MFAVTALSCLLCISVKYNDTPIWSRYTASHKSTRESPVFTHSRRYAQWGVLFLSYNVSYCFVLQQLSLIPRRHHYRPVTAASHWCHQSDVTASRRSCLMTVSHAGKIGAAMLRRSVALRHQSYTYFVAKHNVSAVIVIFIITNLS